MLLFLAASAALAAAPAAPQGSASASARAVIRIVEPVRLRVGSKQSMEGQPVRETVARTVDGRQQRMLLVEIE